MTSAGQQVVRDEEILTSRAAYLRAETASEFPQASYNRARYYDPRAGRFLTEDPLRFAGGINSYAYVSNSAVDFVDPRGLFCEESPWERIKNVNRCAASLSQVDSVHNLSGGRIPEALGSNTVGDIAGLLTGPEPGTDPSVAGNDAIDDGVSLATDGLLHSLPIIAKGLVIRTVTTIGIPISNTAGVYNPVTIATTTARLGGTAAGAAAVTATEVVLALKLGLDAAVYLRALWECAER